MWCRVPYCWRLAQPMNISPCTRNGYRRSSHHHHHGPTARSPRRTPRSWTTDGTPGGPAAGAVPPLPPGAGAGAAMWVAKPLRGGPWQSRGAAVVLMLSFTLLVVLGSDQDARVHANPESAPAKRPPLRMSPRPPITTRQWDFWRRQQRPEEKPPDTEPDYSIRCPFIMAKFLCPWSQEEGGPGRTSSTSTAHVQPRPVHEKVHGVVKLLVESKKSLYFVGDSITREHFSSFACLLIEALPHVREARNAIGRSRNESRQDMTYEIAWTMSKRSAWKGPVVRGVASGFSAATILLKQHADGRVSAVHYKSCFRFNPACFSPTVFPPRQDAIIVTSFWSWYHTMSEWETLMLEDLPRFFRSRRHSNGNADWTVVFREPHLATAAPSGPFTRETVAYPCSKEVNETRMHFLNQVYPIFRERMRQLDADADEDETSSTAKLNSLHVRFLDIGARAREQWFSHPGLVPKPSGVDWDIVDCNHFCIPGVPDEWSVQTMDIILADAQRHVRRPRSSSRRTSNRH